MQGNIKVVVRCRPLNARELARGATCLVKMENNQTILQNPKSSDDIKAFTFDRSYWSAGDKADSDYADQDTVYNDVGREWLDHAFAGYNCCIFAYGQTGSGKSYSMMGYGQDKGIIPRTCSELFERIQHLSINGQQFQVEVSYIEIYNERVRDLLNPKTKHLKVREHPSLGPYVEDLSRLVVKSFDDIEHLMDEGNKARTVAATNMNETSSRSHAVFTIILTQKIIDDNSKQGEKVSRFSLVDLAGSERANSTGASGMRLKEGANINRSLTTLGKVIAGLAEQTTTHSPVISKSNKKRDAFIPYRDSVLTWLLKDSLGGNSKTAMIAAISPADFDETLSTLRYADQAKKIKTKAVVNEDPNVRMIRDLKTEIQNLKQSLLAYVPHAEQLQDGANKNPASDQDSLMHVLPSKSIVVTDSYGNSSELTKREVVDQIKSSQKLLGDIDQSWEERLQTTIKIQQDREQALVDLGITVAKNDMGVYTPKNTPYLVNLNEDPLMSECLVYQIKPGTSLVGQKLVDEDVLDKEQHYIRLSGSNILESHCRFENVDEVVTIYPNENSVTMVNGIHINEPKRIKSGYRIILGDYHVFRFNHPEEARREREEQHHQRHQPLDNSTGGLDNVTDLVSNTTESSSISLPSTDEADWLYARREAVIQYFQQQRQSTDGTASPTSSTAFEDLTNEELEKLFDDVTKLRRIRKRQSSHSGSIFSQPMSPCSSSSSFSYRHSTTPSMVSTVMYENGSGISSSSITADDTDSVVDLEIIRLVREELQQQMDEQKIIYEKRIHRLSCLYPVATTLGSSSSLLTPVGYSVSDKSKLSKVIRHWRDQRYVHLAENLLMNGATLYEVNALARQLKKKVVYQLTIIHNTQAAGSDWEEDLCATRLDPTLLASKKPCIGVRVVDSKHQCTYLWSLDRLKTRLRYMQGIRFVTDQSHHLVAATDDQASKKHVHLDGSDGDVLDLFYDSHFPRFALIGMAKLQLRHLGLHVPMELTLDVFCQRTCRVVGQLTVLVAPIARSKERRSHDTPLPPTIDTMDHVEDLQVGQHLVFEIRIGALYGIDENEFTHVHTQYQLALFDRDDEQIYATPCASQFDKHSSIDFNYVQTFSRLVTADMLDAIQQGELTFEVYGQPQPAYLKSFQDEPCASHQLPSIEKKHNVYAWIEVCELARVSGEYTPVQVVKPANARTGSRLDEDEDEGFMALATPTSSRSLVSKMASQDHGQPKGTFVLRQGHQRRIVLTMRHDWILPCTEIDSDHGDGLTTDGLDGLVLWLGDIRYRSPNGQPSPPAQDISIPLTVVTKTADTLVLQGAWDSSLHNSLLLNRVTEADQTVDLTIKWIFHGAPFQMDVGVQITSGDAGTMGLFKRQSLLRNLFSSVSATINNDDEDDEDHVMGSAQGKKKSSIAGIYRVWERPRRLSTYHVHHQVDSEHHAWQQHQMAKIKSYDRARKSMLMKLEVAHTRYTLALLEALQKRRRQPVATDPSSLHPLPSRRDDLLHSIIHQWMHSKPEERTGLQLVKAFGSKEQLEQLPVAHDDIPLYDVHQIYLSDDPPGKNGLLMLQHYGYMKIRKWNSHDGKGSKWSRRWFLSKRPYLLIYANDYETNELDILNIQAVRVTPIKDLANVFTLYTNVNTYQCQTTSPDEMREWVASMI